MYIYIYIYTHTLLFSITFGYPLATFWLSVWSPFGKVLYPLLQNFTSIPVFSVPYYTYSITYIYMSIYMYVYIYIYIYIYWQAPCGTHSSVARASAP